LTQHVIYRGLFVEKYECTIKRMVKDIINITFYNHVKNGILSVQTGVISSPATVSSI